MTENLTDVPNLACITTQPGCMDITQLPNGTPQAPLQQRSIDTWNSNTITKPGDAICKRHARTGAAVARPLHDVPEGDAGLRLAGPPARTQTACTLGLGFPGIPCGRRRGRAYPMRKVEAPLSMTMGVESGMAAKSACRGARWNGAISSAAAAAGGGVAGGFGGNLCCASSSSRARSLLTLYSPIFWGDINIAETHFCIPSWHIK